MALPGKQHPQQSISWPGSSCLWVLSAGDLGKLLCYMCFSDTDALRNSGPSGHSDSLDLQPVSSEQSCSGKALAEGWPVWVIASPRGLFP